MAAMFGRAILLVFAFVVWNDGIQGDFQGLSDVPHQSYDEFIAKIETDDHGRKVARKKQLGVRQL